MEKETIKVGDAVKQKGFYPTFQVTKVDNGKIYVNGERSGTWERFFYKVPTPKSWSRRFKDD